MEHTTEKRLTKLSEKSYNRNPKCPTGSRTLHETALYYYRARHYDPEAGRFLQSDPLGFAAGDLNLYAYTWNDPANWTDPSGLVSVPEYVKHSAAAVGRAASATAKVSAGALCLGAKVATFLTGLADLMDNGFNAHNITQIASSAVSCRTKVKAKKDKGCGCGGSGRQASNSYPEGTEVLTPKGLVAIETLREGDLVIGRNEETGQSGVFPISGISQRWATDTLWLTLEKGGETTRMGVTSAHPLFVAGLGWTLAGDLAPGDAIRASDLSPMIVLAVELDPTPQLAYNMEVAGAHTYFAGELEAWGHNAGPANRLSPRPNAWGDHTVFETEDECGKGRITKYQTFQLTRTGHWNPGKRFRADGKATNGIFPPLFVCKGREVPALRTPRGNYP